MTTPRALGGVTASAALSLLGTLSFAVVMLLFTGHNPLTAGIEFVERIALRPVGIEESLVAMSPIVLAALSVWIAARVGLWNIGIDGQVVAGAVAAGAIAPMLDSLPRFAMWMLVTIGGVVAGAAWALVPALLRTRSGVNEIVTTIMMTYLALSLASWLVKGPLADPAMVAPATRSVDVSRRLPDIGDSRVHAGVVIALILVGIVWVLSRWTAIGTLSRFVGEAPEASIRVGIPLNGYIIGGFLLSGAVAALAGVSQVLAVRGSVQGDWRPAVGLAAFVALFLARKHVLGLLPAALLLGMLSYASTILPRSLDIAPDFFPMMEGVLLILLSVAAWRGRFPRATKLQPDPPETHS